MVKNSKVNRGPYVTPLAWEKVGECIRCTSHKATSYRGYPIIRRKGRNVNISRLILLHRMKVNESPLFALHTCDNTWCINPAHIVSGTHDENMRQMVSRGRTIGIRVGERNGYARLKESDVREILKNKGVRRAKELSSQYRISPKTVAGIWGRERWKHVT